VVAAGNSATDRLRAPVAPPLEASPTAAEATSMPWTVEVPTRPQPAPEVFWPHPDFRDLPELVSAAPGDQRSSVGGRGAPHGDATFPGGDPAIWLLLGALPLSAVVAVVLRRRLNRQEPDDDPTDVGLALLEPDQQRAPETETEAPADPRPLNSRGAPAAGAAARSAAATDMAPAAATSAAPAQPVALPAPGADTQDQSPPRSNGEAPPESPAKASDGPTRRENTASRVVLFERRPGTPWGR
jgi:hypothetical protein